MTEPSAFERIVQMQKTLMAAPKPAEVYFGASRLLPLDRALKCEFEGATYVAAHPDFWRRFETQDIVTTASRLGFTPSSLLGITIINLDRDVEQLRKFAIAILGDGQ